MNEVRFTGISPVHEFNSIYVKREDIAHWSSLKYPSGSKVRQYMAMTAPYRPYNQVGAFEQGFHPRPMVPCIIGCSANSCMQVYVAATAKQLDCPGIVYTAQRKVKSDATLYAESLGCEVNLVKPGWLSVIRKAARERARALGQVVQWDRRAAIEDTIKQCVNIPPEVKRVIVPTGSGLTAAGVLIGVVRFKGPIKVIAVGTSPMTDKEKILTLAASAKPQLKIPPSLLEFIGPSTPYDKPIVATLPDGTPADPFYAAKALQYLQPFDCLWPPGLRPVISMPEVCRTEFKDWKGPNGQST